jgi:hypothetical protein
MFTLLHDFAINRMKKRNYSLIESLPGGACHVFILWNMEQRVTPGEDLIYG